MLDKLNNSLAIGDKVAVLHKRYSTTTSTLKVGTVVGFPRKMVAQVFVNGVDRGEYTNHTSLTIIKL